MPRIAVPAGPLSPWLRHAHRWGIDPAYAGDYGEQRTSLDFMLMLQLEGESWIWWGPAGGTVALPPGSIAFIPPGVLHAHSSRLGLHFAVHFDLNAQPQVESPKMLQNTGVQVTPRLLAAMPTFTLHRPGPGEDLTLPIVSRLTELATWIERFDRLSLLYRTRSHRTLAAAVEAGEILSWAVRTLAQSAATAQPADAAPQRVMELIAKLDGQRLAQPLPLAALAREAGMGRTAFWSAFVSATGLTPHAYLESRRIEIAARRLLDSRQPIHRIAAEVGYEDPYHFSRVFRRVTGVAPKRYRQRAARGG